MYKLFAKNQSGISVAELLVTLAILWVVVAAVFAVLVLGQDVWNMGESQVDAQRGGRNAFMRMTKEVRQCYEVVDTVNYPTDDYTISMRGIQAIDETMSNTGDNQNYQADYYPWLWNPSSGSGARPTIYADGQIAVSGYTVEASGGEVNFAGADSDRVVEADYTRDAYLKYRLENGQLIRSINNSDDHVVVENVVNQSLGTPIFSQSGKLLTITLIIDKNSSKPPPASTLETQIRLRK